jgi:acyl-coenzyme A synthetase/AMP-(fatty) acid ligase
MPMVPEALEAMLACARLGAIHSVVFGGFARQRTGRPHRRLHPKAIIAASAGSSRTASCITNRCSTPPSTGRHKPDFCVIFQREQEVAKLIEGRDVDWHELPVWRRTRRLRAGRRQPPGLYPLHLGHDRRSPRAWCAPPPGIWSR